MRKKENQTKLRKFLYHIPQYKKYKMENREVPLDMLEKMLYTITDKYAITIQWFSYTNDTDTGSRYWSLSLRNDNDNSHMGSITGKGIYEVIAKVAIFLYAAVKKNKGEIITKEQLELRKGKSILDES